MLKSKKILITGATGFIGKALVHYFQNVQGIELNVAHRKMGKNFVDSCHEFYIEKIDSNTDWQEPLNNVDVVIHLAGRAHISNNVDENSLSEFRKVNTQGSENLAKKAADAGVKRFIYLSSIGVNGVSTDTPFKVTELNSPTEDYAVSKMEAEILIKDIGADTEMEIVNIRPPLVYGAGAPGNFNKLIKLVNTGLPLPLGAVNNKRSFVGIDNLVDLIVTCIDHPNAANETFLVSDDHDVSTTELIKTMTLAAGKKPRLLPIPMVLLKLVGKLTGKQAVVERLCGSLQVDISHTKEVLGWKPPVSFKKGIEKCFLEEQ